jgi:hypothetical protein
MAPRQQAQPPPASTPPPRRTAIPPPANDNRARTRATIVGVCAAVLLTTAIALLVRAFA